MNKKYLYCLLLAVSYFICQKSQAEAVLSKPQKTTSNGSANKKYAEPFQNPNKNIKSDLQRSTSLSQSKLISDKHGIDVSTYGIIHLASLDNAALNEEACIIKQIENNQTRDPFNLSELLSNHFEFDHDRFHIIFHEHEREEKKESKDSEKPLIDNSKLKNKKDIKLNYDKKPKLD